MKKLICCLVLSVFSVSFGMIRDQKTFSQEEIKTVLAALSITCESGKVAKIYIENTEKDKSDFLWKAKEAAYEKEFYVHQDIWRIYGITGSTTFQYADFIKARTELAKTTFYRFSRKIVVKDNVVSAINDIDDFYFNTNTDADFIMKNLKEPFESFFRYRRLAAEFGNQWLEKQAPILQERQKELEKLEVDKK